MLFFSYDVCLRRLRNSCLLLLLASGMLSAAEKGVVRLPVVDQGAEARQEAFVDGLRQQLIQIGGSPIALDESQQEKLEQHARDYITSYRYLNLESGRLLEVRYDTQALEERLKKKGVAVVIEQRPQTIVWLALEQQGQRQLLADGQALAKQFIQIGETQAAPLLFPVLDLDDFQAVDTAEVWGLFEASIRAASARYQTPSVLAGRIYQDAEGRFQGQWLYLFSDRRYRQRIDAESLDVAMEQGAQLVATQLTEQLVSNQQRKGHDGDMSVEFVGVSSAQGYAELLELVRSLAPVRAVQVGAIEPELLRLQLQIDSAPEVVEQLLARESLLSKSKLIQAAPAQPTPSIVTQASGTEPLPEVIVAPIRFDWQGS